jgi:hypothetical protein
MDEKKTIDFNPIPPCVDYQPKLVEVPRVFPPVQINLRTKEDISEALKHLWYNCEDISTREMVEMVMVWASKQSEPEEKFVETLSYALKTRVPHMQISVERDHHYEEQLMMKRQLEKMKRDIQMHAEHKMANSPEYAFGTPKREREPTPEEIHQMLMDDEEHQ